jgi:methylmalonyl-CoA/ethylmalonyl-CoA epimerase
LKQSGYDQVDEQGVRVAMFEIGDSRIELLEPTRPIHRSKSSWQSAVKASTISRSPSRISKKHWHALKAAGVRLVDETPKRGAHNTRIAFVHPSATHGVLLELVEHGK